MNFTILAGLAAAAIGFIAIWSNPNRAINRAFLVLSLHAALWLICLEMAVRGGEYGQAWMRATAAVGAFIPVHLWFIKEIVAARKNGLQEIFGRSALWLMACSAMASITQTEWFVTSESTKEAPGFRWGYYAYLFGIIGAYVVLCWQTVRQVRRHTGVSRLELQIILLGGSLTAFTVLVLMGLRALLHMPYLVKLQPIAVLVFYTGMVIAITTSRIFDARQIILVSLQKSGLLIVVSILAILCDKAFGFMMPESIAFLAMIAVVLLAAGIIRKWLDGLLHFYPEAAAARQAAFDISRREARPADLETAFLGILKGWGHTEHAVLLAGTQGILRGGGVEVSAKSAPAKALKLLRWATPERLARERASPEREALAQLIEENALGVLIASEGPTLTTFVGVGVPVSRRPFTYPQVTQLMELASIMESALERAHYSIKAQRAEQLATVGLVGASLAHEIRNPLVTIKTFVHLLPQHHQDPVFREKFFKLIGDEVTRIDHLTEQLLGLASPRTYTAELIELHPVLRSNLELVAAKAAEKGIEFLTDFRAEPDLALTDPSATKQVLLNLCFNALQALEGREGERWVRVSTRNVPDGLELIVEDSGPGIAPEIRPRLFQPFQTTKSSGFGLGLAICSDILAALNTTITVAPTVPGRGASFRIVFPCKA